METQRAQEPQTNHQAQSVEPTGLLTSRTFSALTLALVGILSACVVYSYLADQSASPASQTASAATVFEPIGDELALEATAAYVRDLKTGAVLYERNADVQWPLASITKVALALVVSDVLSPDDVIVIPFDTSPPGSIQHLGAGERWRAGDVLAFTLVASSNAGAEILAQAADKRIRERYPLAPEGSATLWRMNQLAQQLGLAHTYFLNVHGLDESETQPGAYGSARDVARLFAYAASSSPEIFASTAKNGLLLSAEDGATTSALNTNEALGQIPGLIMGKTGYTDLAGGNLAIVFDAGLSHPVVAVVLGSSYEGRFRDMKALVDATRAVLMHQ